MGDYLMRFGKDLVLSAQVLGEFYVTVRREFAEKLPETEAVALVSEDLADDRMYGSVRVENPFRLAPGLGS